MLIFNIFHQSVRSGTTRAPIRHMALDSIFSSPSLSALKLSMDEATVRHLAVASNLANLNTPGFKRLDVSSSFEQAYTTAMNGFQSGSTEVPTLPQASLETAAVQGTARSDGNTVNVENEMVALAQNSSKFEFAGQMLGAQYRGLKYAITGQNSA